MYLNLEVADCSKIETGKKRTKFCIWVVHMCNGLWTATYYKFRCIEMIGKERGCWIRTQPFSLFVCFFFFFCFLALALREILGNYSTVVGKNTFATFETIIVLFVEIFKSLTLSVCTEEGHSIRASPVVLSM